MKKNIVRTSIAALLMTATLPVLAAAPAGTACAQLTGFKLAGYSLEIESAKEMPAAPAPLPPGAPPAAAANAPMLPAHCRVEGAIDRRIGRDGKPYAIGFAVAMPTNWNGRFYFQGGGGLNGSLNSPVGSQASGSTPALARGFAVASTDSGHRGAGFDASFFSDQEAALNFLYQAVGKVTVVAKELVAKHYGSSAHHAYYVGCSTGGREAMMMSQRFPNYYDGIVSGAPAMRTNYSNLATRWISTSLNAVAPKNEQGKPDARRALSDSDRKTVVDGFLAACDALDGTKDGLVFATQSCRFDPEALVCKGAKADGCLSAPQAAAIKKGFAGPKTNEGLQVYPGFMYDTGIGITGRGIPGLLSGGSPPEGPAPDKVTMDVDAEAAVAHDARSMLGDTDAWTNLSTFHGRGGKLIFYHGISDAWFSALETVRYYEKLGVDNAPAKREDWSRLFLVPGMGHCQGGEKTLDRFDMVDAIVNWVEQNRAPAQVVATGASMPGVSRPLCPFPQHPHYNGTGDANAAANYSCKE